MNRIVLIVLLLILLSSCGLSRDEDIVLIEGRELSDEDSIDSDIGVDFFASEFIEIDYEGTKRYQLDIEHWSNGVFVYRETRIKDIDLGTCAGISIELEDMNDGTFTVHFGIKEERGVTKAGLGVSASDSNTNGRTETKFSSEESFSDEEDIVIWSQHRFADGFNGSQDVHKLAESVDWSLILILKPEERVYVS